MRPCLPCKMCINNKCAGNQPTEYKYKNQQLKDSFNRSFVKKIQKRTAYAQYSDYKYNNKSERTVTPQSKSEWTATLQSIDTSYC